MNIAAFAEQDLIKGVAVQKDMAGIVCICLNADFRTGILHLYFFPVINHKASMVKMYKKMQEYYEK